ncbi:MAG: PAS domain S-box protein [Burkholderiales bacterium]|nr:PAS domain S-box protein [Burkholderiales bacterium]
MAAPPIQSDALFRAAADQAPQVMWIVNTKGAVTYLNQAWYDLVGGEPPKWYGHEWTGTVLEEDVAEMRARWRMASQSGGVFEGTRRVRAADGSLHVLSYRATPVRQPDGEVTCWVGMDADITQLMATEAALRFANQELESFSSSVSHDLRSPLVTVQGFSATLRKHLAGSKDTKVRHYVERISDGVTHLGRLVDGLLVLSHLARARLEAGTIDLSRVAVDILEMHRRQEPARNVVTHVQPGLEANADARLLALLMENLIGNAWKFSAQTDPAHIWLELASETADEKVFAVRDNGAGFDMALAGQLFSPFCRFHTAEQFPGTGIGLATVHRIIARHGGRTWAQSVPGQGTSIFFSLPRR